MELLDQIWSGTMAMAGAAYIVWDRDLLLSVLGAWSSVPGSGPGVYGKPALCRGQHSSIWPLRSLPQAMTAGEGGRPEDQEEPDGI